MKIYGIAFIKNGVKFDFPFKESLLSMVDLVDKIYINVGLSDDTTLKEVKKIPKVEIIEVDWDDRRSDGGHILSDMTNIAIKKMREEIQDESAWAVYLQSDEVLHEDDLPIIKKIFRRLKTKAVMFFVFAICIFGKKMIVLPLVNVGTHKKFERSK